MSVQVISRKEPGGVLVRGRVGTLKLIPGSRIQNLSSATLSHHPLTLGQFQSHLSSLQQQIKGADQSEEIVQLQQARDNHTLQISVNAGGISNNRDWLRKWFGTQRYDAVELLGQETSSGESVFYQLGRSHNQSIGAFQCQTYTSTTNPTSDDFNFVGSPKFVTVNEGQPTQRLVPGIPGFAGLRGHSDVGAPAHGQWPQYLARSAMCIGSASKQERTSSERNVSAFVFSALSGISTVYGHSRSTGPIIQGVSVSNQVSLWAFNIQRGGVFHASSGSFKRKQRQKDWRRKQKTSTNEGMFWQNSRGHRWPASDIDSQTYYLDKISEAKVKTYVVQGQDDYCVEEGLIAQQACLLFPRQSNHTRDTSEQTKDPQPPGLNYAGLVIPVMMALKEQRQINIKVHQKLRRLQKLVNQFIVVKSPR